MLQPLQLKEVSTRYANQIAELQDFFRKADCLSGTAESLHAVATRLQRDRAFHRDLTSHLWVVIDGCRGNISYAGLLGILAIAAGGSRFAAEAEEGDAHALLRFVMEARHALDGAGEPQSMVVASPSGSIPVAQPLAAPPLAAPIQVAPSFAAQPLVVQPLVAQPLAVPSQAQPSSISEPVLLRSRLEAEDNAGSRKRYLLIAACVVVALSLAALSIRSVMRDRATSGSSSAAAPASAPEKPVAPSPASPAGPAVSAPVSVDDIPSSSEAASAPARPSAHTSLGGSHQPLTAKPSLAAPSATRPAAAPVASPARAANTSAASTPSATSTPLSAPATSSPAPSVSAPLIARAAPAPALPARNSPGVSKAPAAPHLGVPSAANATPDFSNTIGERHAPTLVRRTPGDRQELAALSRQTELAVAEPIPTPPPDTSHGTIQANSVGVHAANVLYSPIPAYPPAAFTAHVQGEVKLQTEVNSEGNVVSVRVVSGPPLLRAAALEAAQRWRYRPDRVGGRSIAITAETVFEFHLP